jgi:glycerophosphoryl diester phosphodiesterase
VAALRPLLERTVGARRSTPLLSPPLVIGHRGAAGEAPENTLAAFDLALRQGAGGIEFDVRLSADSVPVVIHDARLDRTTSGSGRVRRLTLAELRRLDAGSWFNRRYPSRARTQYIGLRIPTLAEALAWVRERNCLAYIEIKQGRIPQRGIEAKVLRAVDGAGVRGLSTILSFDVSTLKRLRHLDSGIALGIDFTRPLLAILRARRLRSSTVVPHWAFASRRFLARAHQAGIRVLVWDLDQTLWMRRKITDGVDGIITRYPAKLRAVIRAGREEPLGRKPTLL